MHPSPQVVRLLQQLQHHPSAIKEAAAALQECAAAGEDLIAAELLHLQAGSHAALGADAVALGCYRDAAQRYARLGTKGERVWRLRSDLAGARGRLGLRAAAGEEGAAALEVLRRQVHELGLAEMVVSWRGARVSCGCAQGTRRAAWFE
jgi:hypothetical protein